jgi:hypothetical protein
MGEGVLDFDTLSKSFASLCPPRRGGGGAGNAHGGELHDVARLGQVLFQRQSAGDVTALSGTFPAQKVDRCSRRQRTV